MNTTHWNRPVVIVGPGQMGGVFGRGFLAAGHPVYPVTAAMRPADTAEKMPRPAFVLVAVPEKVLPQVLNQVPSAWQDRLVLIQNELLPYQWEAAQIPLPTVMAVWFEKKKGRGVHVFQPSPVFGPHAEGIRTALDRLDIPCRVLPDETEMRTELIKKNLFVLTINIAGLAVGGRTGELWAGHEKRVRRIAHDVLDIMEAVTRTTCDREDLLAFLRHILAAVPDHECRGRVAADRLNRTLHLARTHDLQPSALLEIAASLPSETR